MLKLMCAIVFVMATPYIHAQQEFNCYLTPIPEPHRCKPVSLTVKELAERVDQPSRTWLRFRDQLAVQTSESAQFRPVTIEKRKGDAPGTRTYVLQVDGHDIKGQKYFCSSNSSISKGPIKAIHRAGKTMYFIGSEARTTSFDGSNWQVFEIPFQDRVTRYFDSSYVFKSKIYVRTRCKEYFIDTKTKEAEETNRDLSRPRQVLVKTADLDGIMPAYQNSAMCFVYGCAAVVNDIELGPGGELYVATRRGVIVVPSESMLDTDDNNQRSPSLSINPNPVSNSASISIEGEVAVGSTLRVVNLGGRTIQEIPITGAEIGIDMSSVAIGQYVLVLTTPEQTVSAPLQVVR